MTSAAAPNQILVTRLIAAPRQRVWDAWTDADQLAQWWGPNGFTITTHEFAFEEGGLWHFTMHGPDGRDYDNRVVYTEIVPIERISHDHGGDGSEVSFQATATFEDEGDKTRITFRSTFASAAERDRVAKEYGAVEGAEQTIGRLAEYVATL